jgi:transcriptional regulator with XRE-family HTH domain
MKNFANILVALRKERRLTQQTVADKLGISQQSYARYEKGDREPSIENLITLAGLFSVPIDILVGRDWFIGNMKIDKVIRSQKVIDGKEKTVMSFRSDDYIETPED